MRTLEPGVCVAPDGDDNQAYWRFWDVPTLIASCLVRPLPRHGVMLAPSRPQKVGRVSLHGHEGCCETRLLREALSTLQVPYLLVPHGHDRGHGHDTPVLKDGDQEYRGMTEVGKEHALSVVSTLDMREIGKQRAPTFLTTLCFLGFAQARAQGCAISAHMLAGSLSRTSRRGSIPEEAGLHPGFSGARGSCMWGVDRDVRIRQVGVGRRKGRRRSPRAAAGVRDPRFAAARATRLDRGGDRVRVQANEAHDGSVYCPYCCS